MGIFVGPQNVRNFDSIGKMSEGNGLIGPEMPIDVGSFSAGGSISRVAPSLLFRRSSFLLSRPHHAACYVLPTVFLQAHLE